jgi:hypothetical protein
MNHLVLVLLAIFLAVESIGVLALAALNDRYRDRYDRHRAWRKYYKRLGEPCPKCGHIWWDHAVGVANICALCGSCDGAPPESPGARRHHG